MPDSGVTGGNSATVTPKGCAHGGCTVRVRRSCPAADRAMRIKPGRSYPLGATYDGSGTNFSLFSEAAQRVELALIAEDGSQECVDLTEMDGFVWHGYLPGVGPGQRYGLRVHGPYAPQHGQLFNPAKLLLDPYAKAIDGGVRWEAANTLPYRPGAPGAEDVADGSDDAAAMPRCVVIDPGF